jgi:hypothetical protein
VFKFLDLMRQRRRRDAETRRRASKLLFVGNGHEISEQAGVDIQHRVQPRPTRLDII